MQEKVENINNSPIAIFSTDVCVCARVCVCVCVCVLQLIRLIYFLEYLL